jgi:two-component system chemotaxis sensor kinase CheA
MKAVLELSAEGAAAEIEELGAEDRPAEQQEPAQPAEPAKETEPAKAAPPPQPQKAAPPQAKKPSDSQTIRVSTEKVDALFDLTSEIVIAQSMLSNTQSRLAGEAVVAVTQMERHVRDLHERVMAIRMIPVGYVFNRFPRMVRDLASSSQKEIRLEIAGEETELDRTLLESLTDPLTHLLRNSVDHGIEIPADRVAAGKTSYGIVRLNAYQAEGRIYIEVSDDGKGINLERVRQKALALEWLREEDNPPPETLYDFLFRPGFSTAEKVSDVSGRGVGMDVVRRNVESLGGLVSVYSELGKGSRFLIKVPLTLAIMDGLKLRVGPEHFIVPLTSVVQSFRPDTVTLCSAQGKYEMINIRGRFLPLLKLSDSFQIEADSRRTEDGILIVLEQDEHQIAVLADEILGQQQVVMKSLEANFVRVPGISGATILGDGRVALILDVGELVRRALCAGALEGVAA